MSERRADERKRGKVEKGMRKERGEWRKGGRKES